jgi:hypothetical protein
VKERKPERISPQEYEDIVQLAAQCRRLMETAVGVAGRLRPVAREKSARGQVRSRLDCVLHDFITPASRDLNAIADAASRHLEDEEKPT